MYGKFVGLDAGYGEYRICLINRGIREVQLLETIRVNAVQSPDEGESALEETFRNKILPKAEIAVALTKNPTSIRSISFPFSDPKKIEQVYGFELENLSTFDPEEKAHAYHLVKIQSGAQTLVCVFEKQDMADLLEAYKEAGLDPKVVTYAPAAMSAMNEYVEGVRPLLLIDLSEKEICFTLFDENGARMLRSSTKIAEKLYDDITLHTGATRGQADFSKLEVDPDALEECLGTLLTEIKNTVKFFEIEIHGEIKTISLSGPLSMIEGLTGLLKRELRREVNRLFIPPLGVEKSAVFAKSYALSLYGSAFRPGYLNFRKDEFRFVGVDRELRKYFLTPALLLTFFILLLIYNAASGYFALKDRVSETQSRIEEVVKDTFPDVKVIPKPAQYMKSEVADLREKLNIIQGVQGGPSPLDILKGISESLPASLNLTVNEIRFEGANNIKIEGICDSYQEVTEIEEALSRSDMFESVQRNQTGNAIDGKTKFEISVVVKTSV